MICKTVELGFKAAPSVGMNLEWLGMKCECRREAKLAGQWPEVRQSL